MSRKKTAVIYTRVSTGKQAEKELPLESQLEQCEQKAASLNAVVVKTFCDEGISGKSDNRPEFQKALNYCEYSDIDYFICWSTSRFARNRLDAQLNKRRLMKCDTEVVYVTVSIEKNGSGILQEGILELFDEYLSYQVGADTKRSMIRNAKDGYFNGGRAGYGFIVIPAPENPKRRRLKANPEEAHIVKDIFRFRLEGIGAKMIAMKLNERGTMHRGKKWCKSSVYAVLKNEKMAGLITFNKRTHDGKQNPPSEWITVESHEGIVTREIFDKVQTLIERASPQGDYGSPRSTRILTGLLRCGACGSSMIVSSANGRSQVYYYYQCRKAFNDGGCSYRRIPVEKLDDYILDLVSKRIFTREHLTELIREMNDLAGNWAQEQKKPAPIHHQ